MNGKVIMLVRLCITSEAFYSADGLLKFRFQVPALKTKGEKLLNGELL